MVGFIILKEGVAFFDNERQIATVTPAEMDRLVEMWTGWRSVINGNNGNDDTASMDKRGADSN